MLSLTGLTELHPDGDEANIWSAKARVLYSSADGRESLRPDLIDHVFHEDYPWLNPLLQLACFEQAGQILHMDQRLVISWFSMLGALALLRVLSQHSSPWVAIVLTCLFVTGETFLAFCTRATADLMVAFSALLAVDAWLRWCRHGEACHLRVLGVCLAFLVASKNEGLLLMAAILAGAWWTHRKGLLRAPSIPPRLAACWLGLPVWAFLGNEALKLWLGLRNDLLGDAPLSLAERLERTPAQLGTLAGRLAEDLFLAPDRSGVLLGIAFILGLCYPRRVLRHPALLPLGIAAVVLVGYVGILATTSIDFSWQVATAADRLWMQLAPLAALGIAMGIGRHPHLDDWR